MIHSLPSCLDCFPYSHLDAPPPVEPRPSQAKAKPSREQRGGADGVQGWGWWGDDKMSERDSPSQAMERSGRLTGRGLATWYLARRDGDKPVVPARPGRHWGPAGPRSACVLGWVWLRAGVGATGCAGRWPGGSGRRGRPPAPRPQSQRRRAGIVSRGAAAAARMLLVAAGRTGTSAGAERVLDG